MITMAIPIAILTVEDAHDHLVGEEERRVGRRRPPHRQQPPGGNGAEPRTYEHDI